VNQIRGLLGEHGGVIAQAIGNLRRALPRIVDDETNRLNSIVRILIGELREELSDFDGRIANYDRKIVELYRTSEACSAPRQGRGIGPIVATAGRSRRRWKMLQELTAICGIDGSTSDCGFCMSRHFPRAAPRGAVGFDRPFRLLSINSGAVAVAQQDLAIIDAAT